MVFGDARIDSLDQLVRLTQASPSEDAARVVDLVNGWFDEDPERYAAALLGCKLGSHREQSATYERLTVERRAQLHRLAAARCRAERLRGLSAGGFMIGRLVCAPHPVGFWNLLDEGEVASILDEWVLHLRYLRLLGDVGERRINRARQAIVERGLPEVRLTPGDALTFIPLKLSQRDLERVAAEVGPGCDPQTVRLLELLRQPYGRLFDFDAPWSVARLRRMCDEAGLALPRPDDA